MARKENKIDWKWLLSLPKYQRTFELKKIAKEQDETEGTDSKLGDEKT